MRLFAASVDAPDVNRRFAAAHHYRFVILSDPQRKLSRAMGVLGILGFANRWTYAIDDRGVVRAILKQVNPKTAGPDLVGALQSLHAPER